MQGCHPPRRRRGAMRGKSGATLRPTRNQLPLSLLLASMAVGPVYAQSYPSTLSNSATLTYSGVTDPSPGDNTAVDDNTLEIQADVGVTKTFLSGTGPFKIGQEVKYRIDVTNSGPSAARDIAISENPTNLTIGSLTGACTSQPCTISSLAPGATASIEVTATIAAAGSFSNSATASLPGGDIDPNPGNNTGDGGGGNAAAPGISIAVAPSDVLENSGTPLVYTITLDEAALVPTEVTLSYGGDATPGSDYTGQTTTVIIPAGATEATVSLVPVSDADDEGQESVIVTIEPGAGYDVGGGQSATGTITDPQPDLAVTKALQTAAPFLVGDEVVYEITVSNNGTTVANGIELTEAPINLDITSVSGACTSVPCTINGLAAGGSVTVEVKATIVAAGAFGNSASANIPGTTDPTPGDNTGDGGGGNAGDLPVATVAVSPASVMEDGGVPLVYTVTLSEPAVRPTVIELSYSGAADPATDYTGSVATITIGTGATTGTVTIMPVVDTVKEPDENVIVTVGTGTGYTVGAQDSAEGVIANDDPGVADLSISKTDNATTYVPGGTATYTITVRNAGPDAASGVTATDNLPSGVTLSGPWTCSASAGSSCQASSGGGNGDTSVVVTVDLDATGEATITVPVKFSDDPADY